MPCIDKLNSDHFHLIKQPQMPNITWYSVLDIRLIVRVLLLSSLLFSPFEWYSNYVSLRLHFDEFIPQRRDVNVNNLLKNMRVSLLTWFIMWPEPGRGVVWTSESRIKCHDLCDVCRVRVCEWMEELRRRRIYFSSKENPPCECECMWAERVGLISVRSTSIRLAFVYI